MVYTVGMQHCDYCDKELERHVFCSPKHKTAFHNNGGGVHEENETDSKKFSAKKVDPVTNMEDRVELSKGSVPIVSFIRLPDLEASGVPDPSIAPSDTLAKKVFAKDRKSNGHTLKCSCPQCKPSKK